jgi:hypothetical protein
VKIDKKQKRNKKILKMKKMNCLKEMILFLINNNWQQTKILKEILYIAVNYK